MKVSIARIGSTVAMPTKGERGNKVTDFSIAAIMAPRDPSFGSYHLVNAASSVSSTAATIPLECQASKGSYGPAAGSPTHFDHREFFILGCIYNIIRRRLI